MILSRFLPLFLLIATTFSVKAVEIVTTTNS